ncbi:MAG: glycosyltransferase [Kiritimatiellae bacterium]|nr:glycosyltransferase [Kiritimatiellia bacterium]
MSCCTVSVVIPNRNHARFLSRRIESVLGQTYRALQVILLDDASTDGSREVMDRYTGDPRVEIHVNEQPSGSPFRQWNKGVKLARGELVWIAESDDYAEPDFLEQLVPFFDNHPGVAMASTDSQWIDEQGNVFTTTARVLSRTAGDLWNRNFVAPGKTLLAEYFAVGNMIPNASAVLFRKAAYVTAGGAPDHMRLCGDWMTWSRILVSGDMAYMARPLNWYRTHVGTVRADMYTRPSYALEWLEVSRFIFSRVQVPTMTRKKAIRELRGRWYRILHEGTESISPSTVRDFLAGTRDLFGLPAAVTFWAVYKEASWRTVAPLRLLFSAGRMLGRRFRSSRPLHTATVVKEYVDRTAGDGEVWGR